MAADQGDDHGPVEIVDRLWQLWPAWVRLGRVEPLPVHIIYAPRKPVPVKLPAFLAFMTPRLKDRLASV